MPGFRVTCTNHDSVASLDVWAKTEDEAVSLAKKIIPKRYWYNLYILDFNSPLQHPWDKGYRLTVPWIEGRLWMTEGLYDERTASMILNKKAINSIANEWKLICKSAKKFNSKQVSDSFNIPEDYLYWAGWNN